MAITSRHAFAIIERRDPILSFADVAAMLKRDARTDKPQTDLIRLAQSHEQLRARVRDMETVCAFVGDKAATLQHPAHCNGHVTAVCTCGLSELVRRLQRLAITAHHTDDEDNI